MKGNDVEKVIEKFIKDMDELIEESLTDEFLDYGDSTGMMDDMASTFLAFKDKVKAKEVQDLPVGFRF